MRKWLIKLLAGRHTVLVNADLHVRNELIIRIPKNSELINIESTLNGARLERARECMQRLRQWNEAQITPVYNEVMRGFEGRPF